MPVTGGRTSGASTQRKCRARQIRGDGEGTWGNASSVIAFGGEGAVVALAVVAAAYPEPSVSTPCCFWDPPSPRLPPGPLPYALRGTPSAVPGPQLGSLKLPAPPQLQGAPGITRHPLAVPVGQF